MLRLRTCAASMDSMPSPQPTSSTIAPFSRCPAAAIARAQVAWSARQAAAAARPSVAQALRRRTRGRQQAPRATHRCCPAALPGGHQGNRSSCSRRRRCLAPPAAPVVDVRITVRRGVSGLRQGAAGAWCTHATRSAPAPAAAAAAAGTAAAPIAANLVGGAVSSAGRQAAASAALWLLLVLLLVR